MSAGSRPWLGHWICIDGVEGAGKTTLTNALVREIRADAISEFSDTLFGEALREAVKTAPHFISKSPLGQSLVFLGDFVETFEARVRPALDAGSIVITDRGWLTKYSYQVAVLETVMPHQEADALVRQILDHVPTPDLTICLTAPAPIIRARIVERDGSCDDERLSFILRAREAEVARMSTPPHFTKVEIDTNRATHVVQAEASERIRAAVESATLK